MIEIVIAGIVVGFASYILFSKFKSKASGGCCCGNCEESKRKIVK